MFLIRFVFYFALSFAILCIPTGDSQHLFDRLYSFVSPYASEAVKSTKKKMSSTKKYTRKLYSNSEPIDNDVIKTKASALKKKVEKAIDDGEMYTKEEQERLQKILNQNE
jgi:hypothetical protein